MPPLKASALQKRFGCASQNWNSSPSVPSSLTEAPERGCSKCRTPRQELGSRADTPPRLTSSFFFFGLLSSPLSSVSDSALRLLPSDFSLSWAVFWD